MHPEIIKRAGEGATNAQIAAYCGCSVRTLERHRAKDPVLSTRIMSARRRWAETHRPGCGTLSQYRRGCRLAPCRQANTISQSGYQAKRRGAGGSHGRRQDEEQVPDGVDLAEAVANCPRFQAGAGHAAGIASSVGHEPLPAEEGAR